MPDIEDTDIENTRTCFRCSGMAVIDRAALARLPELLTKTAVFLKSIDFNSHGMGGMEIESDDLREALIRYVILLDSVPQD